MLLRSPQYEDATCPHLIRRRGTASNGTIEQAGRAGKGRGSVRDRSDGSDQVASGTHSDRVTSTGDGSGGYEVVGE